MVAPPFPPPQDANGVHTADALGYSCHRPMKMVHTFLRDRGCERLLFDARVLPGEIAKGLGGVPFATQFTYGEMGPSGFAAEEGEARVEDEQCNLMLNLLVFGREPQAE